uniref:PI3K/PI4K catalytic domain-containing protein n=1 Tax=Compsopogon caeruleus TaxID=31354 RepID=A0A7S1TH21_9RHOD|eukprot:CAMPEP_0184679276 /NCGR_PEP_ID=MMETSP0312-20130426/2096_1 /TAXON_ID=31354 /ORGANISM="Compsopogon coeruleus, Strain SAG 36.94" /LENGTH=714 /DNA_ID=CAMNT_0027128605 /DNA_START=140 /DNA_END=2284 /DNA_ORIENTATION=+
MAVESQLLFDLIAPEMEAVVDPGTLLTASDSTVFALLPMIVGTLEALGRNATTPRARVVALVDALRARLGASRAIKLRFLLLTRIGTYRRSWKLTLIYRTDCYKLARSELNAKLEGGPDLASLSLTSSSDLSGSSSMRHLTTLDELLTDKGKLYKFALTKMFHPERGLKLRDHRHRMRIFKETFSEKEAVDFLVEHLALSSRNEAVEIAERMRMEGIIERMGPRKTKAFLDGNHPYQSLVTLGIKDKEQGCVITGSGKKVHCFKETCASFEAESISSFELQLPVDLIDMQSIDFWSRDVFSPDKEEGGIFGARIVTHPLSAISPLATPVGLRCCSSGSGMAAERSSDCSESILDEGEDDQSSAEGTVVSHVHVKKVFSSIARPMIVSMSYPENNSFLDDVDCFTEILPNALIKSGDNLLQDQAAEIMFRVFNALWADASAEFVKDFEAIPFAHTYEVIPTAPKAGFMEAVPGLDSLKSYNWTEWRERFGSNPIYVEEMTRSAAGSYIAAYVLGVRDRHWDNILIKGDATMIHIDFGFMLGAVPPIDGPRFSISPDMQSAFEALGCWDRFVGLAVRAFKVLRDRFGDILRASLLLFPYAGFTEDDIRHFLMSKHSFAVHEPEGAALSLVKRQINSSATDWKTKLKAYSHDKVDPLFYDLLERGFPPAVLAYKIVAAKDNKHSKRLEIHAEATSPGTVVNVDVEVERVSRNSGLEL